MSASSRPILLFPSIVLSTALISPALSQEEPGLPVLEEVIVVAQRIEESAQSTPISLASFDASTMETLGIGNIADIQAQVPNFTVDSFPSSNQTLRLFIRGVGISDVQITQDPAVGVYLDGVYLARSTGLAADVADLERIEVLRGPQGTLYGRNTTGGALNLVTARPDPEALSFKQQLGAGKRDLIQSRSVLNLPLGDSSAIKIAALLRKQDGFVDNTGPGGDFGDIKAEAYRLDWRWQPNDSLTLDYAYEFSRVESHNYTPQAIIPGVPSGTPADAAIVSSQRFVSYGDSLFSRLSTSVPLLPTDTDIEGHAITMEWLVGDMTLKSISAFRKLEDLSYIDFASGASAEYRVDFNSVTIGAGSDAPQAYETVRTRLKQEQWSQEFQLIGELGEEFSFLAGIYAFKEDARENWFPMHHIFSFPLLETGDQARAVNIRAEDNVIENSALALYGQLTWSPAALASQWHFSLGLRQSHDEREVDRRFRQDNFVDYGKFVLGPFESVDFAATAQESFNDTSFSLLAEYDFSEHIHGYGKYIEAYKSGGFNTRDPDPELFAEGFDEEKNRTAELGIKGEFLQRMLRVNSALFYSRFSDLQLNFLLPASISDTRVFNSGRAELSGLELDITAMPWYGLLLNINYAYLHSEIDDVEDPFTGESRSFGFVNAPRNTASLNLNYQFPPLRHGTVNINLNYNYVDARNGHDRELYIENYSLLNGRIELAGIALPAGALSVGAWIKNALDKEHEAFTIDNLPHASRAVLWAEPRTWGVELKYEY